MTTSVAEVPKPAQRSHVIPKWDQDLRAAKNNKWLVIFSMACEADFTDEDCKLTAKVLDLDRTGVKVKTPESRVIWINKSMIVGTEVVR